MRKISLKSWGGIKNEEWEWEFYMGMYHGNDMEIRL